MDSPQSSSGTSDLPASAVWSEFSAARTGQGPVPPPFRVAKRRTWSRRTIGLASIAAVGVIAAVWAVIDASSAQDETSQAQALAGQREEARVAGCTFAKDLSTYDYRHIDEYQRQVLDSATGSYKTALSKAEQVQKAGIVGMQSRSDASAVQCGLESYDDGHADVMVASTVAVTDKFGPHPQPERLAAVATLVNVDGHWLTSNLDIITAPLAPAPPPPPPPGPPVPPPAPAH